MGKSKANNLPMIGLCMLILVIVAGCAPAFRAHPQLQEKVQSIKTVAIMPPGVKVYQLAVGGGTQLMDEETVAATHTVTAAIEKELGRHAGVVFKQFPSPTAILDTSSDLAAAGLKDELADAQALFEAVSASVILHTYHRDAPDQTFQEKLKNFDYSLGPEMQRLAKLANADVLLFISGVDHISTGGRKALRVIGTLALIVITLPIGGGGGYIEVAPPGTTTLSMALVDGKTGALLWYSVVGNGLGHPYARRDTYLLSYPDHAAELVERVFNDFPVGGRLTRNE